MSTMAWITHCLKCGRAYEESSRENADSPMRMCGECWQKQTQRSVP